jgi:glutamine cyclotransferase
VLNGLAFDSETGRIFVTGKLWPSLFEIEVIPTP